MDDRTGKSDKGQQPAAHQESLRKPGFETEVNPVKNEEKIPPRTDEMHFDNSAENEEGEVNSAAFAAQPLPGTFPFANQKTENVEDNNKSNGGPEAASASPATNEANREDEALVRQVLNGNVEVFAKLIDKYKVAVYNLCARMLNDPDEAEDAAQEVFLRAYNQLHTYQSGRRFSTWILSIASHYCIDLLRRRRPVTDLDSIAFWKASDQPEPEESAVAGENRDEVRELLRKLPEKYRSVTILRYWQDLSYEEIAEATGLSVATVKTRLFRARELLAKELEKQRRNGGDAGSRSQEERKFIRNRSGVSEASAKPRKVKGNQNVLP